MNNNEQELPDDIYREVVRLSSIGDEFDERGLPVEAITSWRQALALLPTPKRIWDASVWLNASIGDAFLQVGDWENACRAFREAENSGNGFSNAFVQFGLGVSFFELGDAFAAKEHLLRAYMLEGYDLFADADPKYLSLLIKEKLI